MFESLEVPKPETQSRADRLLHATKQLDVQVELLLNLGKCDAPYPTLGNAWAAYYAAVESVIAVSMEVGRKGLVEQ
jgi:hypothetical protein